MPASFVGPYTAEESRSGVAGLALPQFVPLDVLSCHPFYVTNLTSKKYTIVNSTIRLNWIPICLNSSITKRIWLPPTICCRYFLAIYNICFRSQVFFYLIFGNIKCYYVLVGKWWNFEVRCEWDFFFWTFLRETWRFYYWWHFFWVPLCLWAIRNYIISCCN